MPYKKINIAIVGFGNIGSYFYRTLEKNKKKILAKTGKIPVVKYICTKNVNKKRKIKFPKSKWVKNYKNLAHTHIGPQSVKLIFIRYKV